MFRRKRAIRELRDFSQWIKGNFVPTESKLRAMEESGFSFPAVVKTLDKPMDVAEPEDYFVSDKYEGDLIIDLRTLLIAGQILNFLGDFTYFLEIFGFSQL